MHSSKVVLVSSSGYKPERDDPLLQELINCRVELFCAVGHDAEQWEEAIDWICISSAGDRPHFITTTSHPGESVEEVIAFAESFRTQRNGDVEILYV